MHRQKIRNLIILVILSAFVCQVSARNLRLVETDGVDATSLNSLVETVTQGCETDREKMIALWAYITRNPFYHWCEARENPEGMTELGVVYDPIIAFNVYGTVICYQVADLLSNLADAAGIKTRTRGVPGHKVMEAFYVGQWHLFDAQYDLQAYYVADDGKTIVSLDELCNDPGKYIRNPQYPSDPFFQFDHFGGNFWPWEAKEYVIEHFFHPDVPAEAYIYAPYIARGHTIHLDLRRGEKLIRNFRNEGKWFCSPAFQTRWKRDHTQRWVDDGPHDPRNPENTYANGALIYEPDWKANELNFYDGLYDGENFILGNGKIHPQGGRAGTVVFRVQSPYLIVGDPGKLDVDGDSRDGAIFEAEFFRKDANASNTVAISTDNGISWIPVWENDKVGERTIRLDLTNYVEGTYGYLIRVTLRGDRTEDASLSKMRLRNSLFFSPIPLPAVEPGENEFTFAVEEEKGILAIRPDLGDADNYRRFFYELEDLDYDENFTGHLSPTEREGYALIEVIGPDNSTIEWLTVHASLGVTVGDNQGEEAEILYATDPEGEWRPAWRSDFSQQNDKWRWDDSVDIHLPHPARKCYVKFLLKRNRRMSLNMARIYAHYIHPAPALDRNSVTITHKWIEDGESKTYTIQPILPNQDYAIKTTGNRIEDESIVMEVANDE